MTTTTTIERKMNAYENVSLRKLAIDLDISYQMLLKTAKKPKVGCPYDPNEINYNALQEYFDKKAIDLELVDWIALNQEPIRKVATLSKDINDFNVGDKVYLRQCDNPYTIIYKTDTHIVIIEEGSTEPRCLSHSTFFFKGASHTPRNHKEEAEE